jgi:hypothetical protein
VQNDSKLMKRFLKVKSKAKMWGESGVVSVSVMKIISKQIITNDSSLPFPTIFIINTTYGLDTILHKRSMNI